MLFLVVLYFHDTCDTIAIFIRSRNTPHRSDESHKYLRGSYNSPKQCLIQSLFHQDQNFCLFSKKKRNFSNRFLIKTIGQGSIYPFQKTFKRHRWIRDIFAKDGPISA